MIPPPARRAGRVSHTGTSATVHVCSRDRERLGEFQHDVEVSIRSNLAWLLLLLGFPDQAGRRSSGALEAARALGHPTSLVVALHRSCQFRQLRRDLASAREELAELRALADRHQLPFFSAFAEAFEGVRVGEEGRWPEAVERTRHAVEIFRTGGIVLLRPYLSALFGQTLARAGHHTEAAAVLGQALERVEATDERWFEAELRRLSGELHLHAGRGSEAARCFASALGVAQRQEARWWELRAATSLCRLWAENGERERAHDTLAPIYDQFIEGFDTPDLRDARALLDGLR
jgi:predicted ATPase